MDKNKRILELSDAEFLSFLFSERDRENNLSQYPGWNNWALVGAIITVLGVMYSTLKDFGQHDWLRSMFYATGVIAFFLAYHSWLRLLKRERGHDYSRVRLLKEMTPWTEVGLFLVTAMTASILIIVYDGCSFVFLIWIITTVVQLIAVLFALVNKNKLVPFYFNRAFFPRMWWNITYDAIICGLFSWIGTLSFKRASFNILCPEFELGICIGAVAVLIYLLITIRVENRVAEKFDAIVDMYIYAGVSKEETYQTILCNRMGYGIVDICKRDLYRVQSMTQSCADQEKELIELKAKIQNDGYNISEIRTDQRRLKEMLRFFTDSINQSKKLTARMNEMIKVAPVLDDIAIIKTVVETNQELYSQVDEAQAKVGEIISLFDRFYCERANARCANLNCEHRNDPKDKKYIRQLRRHHIIVKERKNG